MNLTRLNYFGAIVTAGSITRASQVLNVAQPALSRQVRLLEDELGVKLLERSPSGVSPTRAGRILLDRSASVIARVAALKIEVRAAAETKPASLRLGVPPALARHLGSRFIAEFARSHPEWDLKITEAWTGNIARLLRARQIDVGVICGTQLNGLTSSGLLVREALHLVRLRPPGSVLPPRIEARELAEIDLIVPTEENGTRLLLDSFFAASGLCPNIKYEAASWGAIKSIVEGGHASAVLPLREVRGALDLPNLSIQRIVRPSLRHTLHISVGEQLVRQERTEVVDFLATALTERLKSRSD